MPPYLVVLLGDDERQGRAEDLRDDRSKIVADAHGERDHLSEPKLEHDQNAHVALGFDWAPTEQQHIDARPKKQKGPKQKERRGWVIASERYSRVCTFYGSQKKEKGTPLSLRVSLKSPCPP